MKLADFSDTIRDNKEIVMEFIRIESNSFRHTSPRLRDDKEVIMHAIAYNYTETLKYCSDRLKNDPEIVIKAITLRDPYNPRKFTSYRLFKHASKELRSNKQFILEQIIPLEPQDDFPYFIGYISNNILEDEEVISKYITHCNNAFLWIRNILAYKYFDCEKWIEFNRNNSFQYANLQVRLKYNIEKYGVNYLKKILEYNFRMFQFVDSNDFDEELKEKYSGHLALQDINL